MPSAKAIAKGLAAGHTAERPGHWLHICGTGMLLWRDIRENRLGQPPLPDEKYDDIADIVKITTSIPDDAIHRDVDQVVLGASSSAPSAVQTAIVSPPCIFGPGRGPANTRSIQVYDMVRFALGAGFAPVLGTGRTEWDHVHVHDLSDLVVSLAEEAAAAARGQAQEEGGKKRDHAELFGEKGYLFCEAGAHSWGDVAKWVADELVKQGFWTEPKVQTTTIEEVTKDGLRGARTWALNSKSFASRARKYLGWEPTRGGLKEGVPEAVSSEAARLGVKPRTG